MSQTQSWPLSQKANKPSGICSVCRTVGQLHLKDGTIHRHGPRKKPCPGSHKPPLSVLNNFNAPQTQTQSTTLPAVSDSQQSTSTLSVVSPVSVSSQSPDTSTDPVWQPITFGLIKHIPRSARHSCAQHLAGLLRNVSNKADDPATWISLLNWGGSILQPLKRGGKRHNLTSSIKRRISSFSGSSVPDLEVHPVRCRSVDPSAQLRQAVASKLEDGNLRAAIRILCSDDAPLPISDDSFQQLQSKHPTASPFADDLVDVSLPSLSVDEQEVRQAAMSFPAGSSGGPDGLRPQHLKDMLPIDNVDIGFLSALTGFVNTVLGVSVPLQ